MKTEFTEQDYLLGLSLFRGIGYKTVQKIKRQFRSLRAFWQANSSVLYSSGLPYNLVQRFLIFRQKTDLLSHKLRLEKELAKVATFEDNSYPKQLKNIASPPLVLYYKGALPALNEPCLAVVGSRKPTAYGREVTEKFVSQLASLGFCIVSGLARGIDSVAHRAVLRGGGRTVAVLGSGLDIIYPPEHRGLAEEIIKSGGVVISEYPLGQKPSRAQFPARNRIISGLSLGVLITEGASRSGTKHTASFSAEQGREVFCVPGPISSPLSAGPADLIKVGAKLTTSVNDILEELQSQLQTFSKKGLIKGKLSGQFKPLVFSSPQEEKVYRALEGGSRSADQLVHELRVPPPRVFSSLTSLELRGLVKNMGEGQYALV
jgi:DNA processing protein